MSFLSASKNSKQQSLFNRSAVRQPLRSLSPQNSVHRSLFNQSLNDQGKAWTYCVQHPNKTAEFYTEGSRKIGYCGKCAVRVASQGIKVNKVKEQPIGQWGQREKQVQQFMAASKTLLEQLLQKKNEVELAAVDSQGFYNEQLQEVEEYFRVVVQSLQLQKHKCYQHILKQRLKSQAPVRACQQQIDKLEAGLKTIVSDLDSNYNTVMNVQEGSFLLVFNNYQQQQRQYQETLWNLAVPRLVFQKTEFTGVSPSIHSLSDIIIEGGSLRSEEKGRLQSEIKQMLLSDQSPQTQFFDDDDVPEPQQSQQDPESQLLE